MKRHLFVFMVVLAILPAITLAKLSKGTIETKEDWIFVERFCFLSSKGKLYFDFTYPLDYEPIHLLLYYDEEDQWPAVYKSGKTCKQKESPPHINQASHQMIVLDTAPEHEFSGCSYEKNNVTLQMSIRCRASQSFRSVRERWWYIALSRCSNDSRGLAVKYELTMTNGKSGSIFFRHFSADEFYILQTDIAFLVLIFLVILLSIYVASILKSRQLFHTTYQMYMTSLCLECVHLFFMCIAYGKYANDGLDNAGLKLLARVMEACSILVFLLMLIVMAKGYTITRGRLSSSGTVKIGVFMTLYSVTYAVLFIYEAKFFDPGEVLYIYESPAGYGLVGLRLIGWAWFCYAIFFTLKHYPEKSTFYYPFFLIYTLWFLTMPVIVLISTYAIDKWAREKAINGVENAITFVGHIVFLVLTRPSAANSNFPYTTRTSQIGIMTGFPHSGAPNTASQDTDSFGMHNYAPSTDSPEYRYSPNFSELFGASNPKPAENGNTANYPHQRQQQQQQQQPQPPRQPQNGSKDPFVVSR